MKCITLLFAVSCLLSFTPKTFSQIGTITLEVKNKSVKEILLMIENETEFYFTYNPNEVNTSRKVSLSLAKENIFAALASIFDKENVGYVIEGKHIALYKIDRNRGENITERQVSQQSIRIIGTVIDENGIPLPGANVSIKGTTIGVITGLDGEYSINVPNENTILIFTYIGYVTSEYVVGSQKEINVTLIEDTFQMDEVVVIGYGTQKKINLTGSVSNINFESDAIASRPLTNSSSALSGMSPGLVTRQGAGTPDSDGASLRIRGVGTLNNSDPLVLIDGQPGDINSLSPNDIATITILKDAASSAIYGSRAANGVILVTTKSGANSGGKISFDYTGNIGFSNPTKLYDVISNTADHMILVNQIDRNSGRNPSFTQERIDEWREKSKTDPLLYPNTDWWDAMINPNTINNHSLSAKGGNEKIRFFNSFNYLDNNGIIENMAYERFTFRNNLTYQVNDWLKLGNNITAMLGKSEPSSPSSAFSWWEASSPGTLPKHPDGRYGGAMTGGSESSANNQLATVENALGERKTQRYTGKLFTTITPIKGLEITGSYFLDMYNYDTWSSAKTYSRWDFQTEQIMVTSNQVLSISNSYRKTQRNVIDAFANYSTKFSGKHDITVLAGFNQEYFKENGFNASKRDLYSIDIPTLDAAPTNVSSGGNASDFAMRSFFGRVNYEYDHKYLLEANIRADGSSRFSPNNRWGYFPSFSAGWRISEESFWERMNSTIDYLKIRASWGRLGNNQIGNYDWQDVYSAANHSFNGVIVKGLAIRSIVNSDITWETTDVFNVGVDFNLFKNLSLVIEYYNKYTHGILYRDPIPYVNGGLTAPMINSAEVRNTGVETDINYKTKIGKDFNISVGFNGSFNKNKIEKYKGDFKEPRNQTVRADGFYSVWVEGQPLDKFYVREIDHIIQDQSEIDKMLADGWSFSPSTPGPGDFLYKDQNGDKKINDDDRVLKGNPIPIFSYGVNLSMSYKGFDFYTLLSGVTGWDRYISSYMFSYDKNQGYLLLKEYQNSWTEANRSTTIPKIYFSNARNEQVSTAHLYDASYMRVKSIQLGYTVPSQITNKIQIGKIRTFINFENFFTFTSYPGMDPETTGNLTYPLFKTFSFGINLNF